MARKDQLNRWPVGRSAGGGIQTSLVVLWIGINLAGAFPRWDPYPFVLLNL